MIGKITNEIVEKCNFIEDVEIDYFRNVLNMTLGKYDIKEKETALIPYDEQINRAYKMFFVAKKVEGLSKKTLSYYQSEVDKFLSEVGKPIDQIATDDVRYYLAMKQMRDRVSETTADNTRRILNSFYSWLNAEGYVAKNIVYPIKSIKRVKKVKHAFTDEEIEKIKEVCLRCPKSIERKRNIALIEVLLSTGCRVGEIVGMKVADINFNNKSIVVFGKGKKERKVFFNDKAIMRIKEYLLERENYKGIGYEYLFTALDKPYDHLRISAIETIVRNIGNEAGVDKCHPHKFRRTAATIALRRGMALTDIQKMLGHENLDTTRLYLDMTDDDLELQHRKFM